eukprot:CAMPEP_0194302732 /NCGR_PEP_ID=MMETSP0171-20130528/590_1 /TAXON_ID=218684 /ORGANISM="Corethron pennatum, Strain L29A3" /LENGTH=66 /DNA_ID=CAMNT_0039053327 /DNA_START=192 /DNA_END=389 /DNA_ORIENTATION=-
MANLSTSHQVLPKLFLRAADMRDGKESVRPAGSALPLMVNHLKAVMPDVHADTFPAATDRLYFGIP